MITSNKFELFINVIIFAYNKNVLKKKIKV